MLMSSSLLRLTSAMAALAAAIWSAGIDTDMRHTNGAAVDNDLAGEFYGLVISDLSYPKVSLPACHA